MEEYHQRKKQKFHLIGLLYSVTQFLTLYITVLGYMKGYKALAIILTVLWVLDKAISLIICSQQLVKHNLLVWFLDFINLGFLNSYESVENGLNKIYYYKLYFPVYVQIIVYAFIPLFAAAEQNLSFYGIIIFVNYILLIALACFDFGDNNPKRSYLLKGSLVLVSHFLCFRYMISANDGNGVNLGFYWLGVCLVNLVISFVVFTRGRMYLETVLTFNFYCIFINYASIFEVKHQMGKSSNLIILSSKLLMWLNSIFCLIVILINAKSLRAKDSFSLDSTNELAALFAITITSISIIYFSPKMIRKILFQKYFIINSEEDYNAAASYMKEKHPHIYKINIFIIKHITFSCEEEEYKIENQNQIEQGEGERNCTYYRFCKGISHQHSLKMPIRIDFIAKECYRYGPASCLCSVQKYYSEEEFVHTDEGYIQFDIMTSKLILEARFNRGLIFTPYSQILISHCWIKSQNDGFKSLQAFILEFNGVVKKIYPEMTFSPHTIGLDLYMN